MLGGSEVCRKVKQLICENPREVAHYLCSFETADIVKDKFAGKDGVVKGIYNNQFDPESHIPAALDAL